MHNVATTTDLISFLPDGDPIRGALPELEFTVRIIGRDYALPALASIADAIHVG